MSELEYTVNADDRISSVNDAWRSFAEVNEGRALLPPGILGRSLWEFIADRETRYIYQVVHDRIRGGGSPVRLSFRCDAPERRRLLQVDVLPRDDAGLLYRVLTVKQALRPFVPLLDSEGPRAESFLTMCAWCKRVDAGPGGWLEVEDAVVALELFDAPRLPQLTHGVCEECSEGLSSVLEGRGEVPVHGRW